jgi:hypothetical protein
MDVCCPSLPEKIFAEQTTKYVAAYRCHRIKFSLYVLLINIEVSSLTRNPFVA